jgi:protein SCO1/2
MTHLSFGEMTIMLEGGKPFSQIRKAKTMRPQFGAVGLALLLGFSVAIDAVPVLAHSGHEHGHASTIKRSVVEPRIPRLTLVRDDGTKVDIGTELEQQGPIYLNFIYTSCGSVCPVLSQTFSVLADRLGSDRSKVRMISLSIDPEYDTPSRLAAYRQQFGADASWRFYTGSLEASAAVQKAFGVLSRDKMNHPVATFYRPAAARGWVRIDGFASPEQLEAEYRSSGRQ